MTVQIPGTNRIDWPDSTFAADVTSTADLRVTAWLPPAQDDDLALRARALCAEKPLGRAYAQRTYLRRHTDADPQARQRLRAYCETQGIAIVGSAWRSAVLSAPIQRLIAAFGATAAIFTDADGSRFRNRSGSLHLPPEIAPSIRGVFGLHQWPRSRRLGKLQRHATPLTARQIALRYAFPEGDGTGQTIGIVQFRGVFRPDDFDRCMHAQGVTTARPLVKRVDNAALQHDIATAKDLEAALDSQIIAMLAPGAQIVIYQAPDDERGFLDAVRTAIFDEDHKPSILSISYGWPEHLWTPVALDILNELFCVAALAGISVFCSSGDNGAELDYDGQPHVIAPASSPFVHACGATVISSEAAPDTAWEHSGGGFSAHFAAPPWQDSVGSIAEETGVSVGRGVPDFAAQQLPGYSVFLNNFELALGGTSAVAPMWSALAARINQRLGVPIGLFSPTLYSQREHVFQDVTEGSNGRFTARAGWDPCTGLGVPIGGAIETALR